jgi:hypothetical protein
VTVDDEEQMGGKPGKLKSRSCLIATQTKLHSSLLPTDVDEQQLELGMSLLIWINIYTQYDSGRN